MTHTLRWTRAVLFLIIAAAILPMESAGQSAHVRDAATLKTELHRKLDIFTTPSPITSQLKDKWEYSWNETDWKLEGNTLYVYNEWGRTEAWKYTWNGTALVNETRTLTTPGGTSFTLTVNEAWDSESSAFVPVDQVRSEFVYDLFTGEPAVTSSEWQEWNGSEWENVERSTYTYGDNLTLTGSQDDVWMEGAWVPESRSTVTQEGADVHIVDESFDGTTWVKTQRHIFRGLTVKELQTRLNQIGTELIDFEEMMYGFHLIPDSEMQEFDGTNWVNSSRQIREYDYQNGNFGAVVYEIWEEGVWVPFMRYVLEWETPSLLASMSNDFFDGESWMTFITETYGRDDQGSISDVVQQIDLGLGLENSARYSLGWNHVGSDTEHDDLPGGFALDPAYPNPFNPATNLTYHLAATGQVAVRVYDALGRHVATLAEGMRTAGSHDLTFEGANLPSGQYIVRMEADGFTQSRVVTLLK